MIRSVFVGGFALLAFLPASLIQCNGGRPPAPPTAKGLVEIGDRAPLLADDSERSSLLLAIGRSLDQLERLPADRSYNLGERKVTVADLQRTLEIFRDAVASADEPIDWGALVQGRFDILRAATPGPLVFTGYYEPELRASREATAAFNAPIYRVPDDLVDIDLTPFCEACAGTFARGRVKDGSVVPYYSRAEIDDLGVLHGRDLELAWLDNPVDAFFLHVQGSGVLHFDDNSIMRVGYADSNGRPYRSLGKLLVERGSIPLESASLQSIKDYIRDHPWEERELFDANERYIFFRPVPVGPIGSFGVPLTAGRSIAVDPKSYPLGTLAFVRTERPGEVAATMPLARFVLPQDTGAAITGPARVDVFWGTGPSAERIAGPMRSEGELYVLVAR